MSEEKEKPLTPKQQLFINAYLGKANFNATEAARLAGYKDAEVSGWENKQKPEIQAAISQRITESAMGPGEVLTRLAEQARASMSLFYRVNRNGRLVMDSKAADDAGLLRLVKKVTEKDGRQSIELYDAQNALIQLGRHHKLFIDRTENDDPDLNGKIERQLERLRAEGKSLGGLEGMAGSGQGEVPGSPGEGERDQ